MTLPGAFVGVLLGSGDPVQAAAAQVLVLIGLLAAEGVAVVITVELVARAGPPRTAGRCSVTASGQVGGAHRTRSVSSTPHRDVKVAGPGRHGTRSLPAVDVVRDLANLVLRVAVRLGDQRTQVVAREAVQHPSAVALRSHHADEAQPAEVL